ncbi:TerB family tellurite resistance protein [Halomonas sp. McH1-25]|uniref:tellurite resistance TerB family protein n=1 Tax=unclassified Halomonas TaxID=2609666 RepID=UPI001EF4A8A0|nr:MULTISPECIES: TerB family tellurite resistance protein [unclassified Halomonas]MCG7598767.1 TerB family tellurite resistance protein [Halomonas sp. McH1-25]MCP1340730.1 TerB family tellurite resistance protein [Halomonas sp. FL8]MCP1359501.1 TerB family tellurite resistance protein [Halomonas sp. BBD45]MCP1365715.1 TerB family tellurite resistance protein [Halomonas sp. BBD48]
MLDAIQQFFNRTLAPQDGAQRALTLELATAALLCEVVRADYQTGAAEIEALRDMLRTRFALDRAAVDELMDLAAEEADQAVDHFQFVRLVNEHYGYADKVELVELMWRLAYADDQLDALEEHRIRKLADLLFVRHSDFIRTKLRVQDERDGAQP